jgi:hypothetical protein
MKMPQCIVELLHGMDHRKGGIMSVSETMALTLLVTGSLSLYLVLHAVLDLYRHGPHRDE